MFNEFQNEFNIYDVFKYSITNQISLNGVDEDGNNIIHYITTQPHNNLTEECKIHIIRTCIQQGIHPDKANKFNKTPLHLACENQFYKLIDFLVNEGADVNFLDNMGSSPLHYLLLGKYSIIEMEPKYDMYIEYNNSTNIENKIIDIRKIIWNNIKNEPLFESLKNTIKLYIDTKYIDEKNKLLENISKISQEDDLNDKLTEILILYKNNLRDKIINDMHLNTKIDIVPHKGDKLSWSPLENDTQLSLITFGNTKKYIKDMFKKAIDNIENFNLEKMAYDDKHDTNIFIKSMAKLLINYIPHNKLDRDDGILKLDDENIDPDDYIEINKLFRHNKALSNASDIIDLEKKTFIKGPRYYTIKLTETTIYDTFKKFKDYNNYNKKLLYCLLYDPSGTYDINQIGENFGEFNTYNDDYNYSANNAHVISILFRHAHEMDFNTSFKDFNYISLRKLVDLNYRLQLLYDNLYFKKWSESINDNIFLIYEMYSELFSKLSHTNLSVPFNLQFLMLIGAIINDDYTYEGIYNIFKPHLLVDMLQNIVIRIPINDEYDHNEFKLLLKKILLFMFNFIEINNIDYLDTLDINHLYDLDNKEDICDLIDNIHIYSITKVYDILNKLYDEMEHKLMRQTFLDIVEIIKIYYKYSFDNNKKYLLDIKISILGMSAIYILQEDRVDYGPDLRDPDRDPDISEFLNKINFIGHSTYMGIIDNDRYLPMKLCELINNKIFTNPSYNLLNIKIEELASFQVAHCLGLRYEGYYEINSGLNSGILHDSEGNKISILGTHDDFDINLAGRKLPQNIIPLPLNYIKTNNPNHISVNLLNNYYKIIDDNIVMPSKLHFVLLYKKKLYDCYNEINKEFQNIKNNIINIRKGSTKNLYKIAEIMRNINSKYSYFAYNFNIIIYYMRNNKDDLVLLLNKNIYEKWDSIVKNITVQVNKLMTTLKNNLENINIYYYTYYYIFEPTNKNKIHIPTFSYYYLDQNIYYYDVKDIQNINILNDDDFTRRDKNPKSNRSLDHVIEIKPIDFRKGFYDTIDLINPYNYEKQKKNKYYIQDKKDYININIMNNDFFIKNVIINILTRNIEIFNTTDDADPNKNEIKTKLTEIIKFKDNTPDIYNSDQQLLINHYKLYADILYETFKTEIKFFISNIILDQSKLQLSNIPILDYNDFNEDNITTRLYSQISSIKKIPITNYFQQNNKNNNYILYDNNFTSTELYKNKKTIYINKEILELLIKNNCNPYQNNFNEISSLKSILEIYYFDIINEFKNLNIKLNSFENNKPYIFIISEHKNNLDKLFMNINTLETFRNTKISNIFNNIHTKLSNEIKLKMRNKELNYVCGSFNMSCYLMLQFLSEELINLNPNYTLDNLKNIIPMIIFNDNIKKNYMYENLHSLKIYKSIKYFYISKLLNDEQIKLDQLNDDLNKYNEIKNSIIHFDKLDNTLVDNQIDEITNNIRVTTEKITDLNTEIKEEYLVDHNYNDKDIIERYQKFIKTNLVNEIWLKMYDTNINDNYNLNILHLLFKQKEYINNINDDESINKLKMIRDVFKNIAMKAEKYFVDDNDEYKKFIVDKLKYMTEIVICRNIEIVIRYVLEKYISNTLYIADLNNNLNSIIEHLLNYKIPKFNKSLLDILYKELSYKFVNLVIRNIDNDKSITDILNDYLELFLLLPFFISESVYNKLKEHMLNIFSDIIEKLILYWHVNCENILKYMINNYRCLEILICLLEE